MRCARGLSVSEYGEGSGVLVRSSALSGWKGAGVSVDMSSFFKGGLVCALTVVGSGNLAVRQKNIKETLK